MHWLFKSWRLLLPTPWCEIALTLVAIVCGAVVGGERERQEKPAGLRTLMLVSLGSAAFTMLSFVFASTTSDSGRVAAQVVAGIGFLCAGVIIHGRGMVTGTTTAASIWATAAAGMTAGSGFAGAALGLSLCIRGVLTLVRHVEGRFLGPRIKVVVDLDFDPNEGRARIRLERVLVDYQLGAVNAEWSTIDTGLHRLRLTLQLPRRHRCELLDDLVAVAEVKAVRNHPL